MSVCVFCSNFNVFYFCSVVIISPEFCLNCRRRGRIWIRHCHVVLRFSNVLQRQTKTRFTWSICSTDDELDEGRESQQRQRRIQLIWVNLKMNRIVYVNDWFQSITVKTLRFSVVIHRFWFLSSPTPNPCEPLFLFVRTSQNILIKFQMENWLWFKLFVLFRRFSVFRIIYLCQVISPGWMCVRIENIVVPDRRSENN